MSQLQVYFRTPPHMVNAVKWSPLWHVSPITDNFIACVFIRRHYVFITFNARKLYCSCSQMARGKMWPNSYNVFIQARPAPDVYSRGEESARKKWTLPLRPLMVQPTLCRGGEKIVRFPLIKLSPIRNFLGAAHFLNPRDLIGISDPPSCHAWPSFLAAFPFSLWHNFGFLQLLSFSSVNTARLSLCAIFILFLKQGSLVQLQVYNQNVHIVHGVFF